MNFKYLCDTSRIILIEGVGKASCDCPYCDGVTETDHDVCVAKPLCT